MKTTIINWIFACFFIVLSVQPASSQIRFGVKGGIDVIDHKITSNILNVENRLGYQVGATLEFLPLNGFGLETGLFYGQQKFDVKGQVANQAEISDYNYLSIPLNLKMRISFTQYLGIYATGGVYGATKLKGGDLSIAFDEFKSKQFEGGINAGFGVSLFKNFDIGLKFRYKLTDNYDVDRPSLSEIVDLSKSRPKYWSVSAAIYF